MAQSSRKRRQESKEPPTKPAPAPPAIQIWTIVAALLTITLVVFGQSVGFSFVDWDDPVNLTQNPWLVPNVDVGHFWRTPYLELYVPVAYTFWAMLAAFGKTASGLNPAVFHEATLFLHLVNTTLVLFLLRRFVKNDIACGMGALVFAIHPLQVESVCWVTETRGTLASAFGLLALHAYWRGVDTARAAAAIPWMAIATVLFVCGLLSKPTLVMLPIILIVLDTLVGDEPLSPNPSPLQGKGRSDFSPTPSLERDGGVAIWQSVVIAVMWLVIAAIAVLKTRSAQPVAADIVSATHHSGLVVASDALAFYVAKLIAPVHLGMDYGWTPMWIAGRPWAMAGLMVPVLLVALVWGFWKRAPAISAGILIYVAFVLPVLGLVPFAYEKYSIVADRYVYLGMVGPALIVAWLCARAMSPSSATSRAATMAVAGIVLVLLAALSFRQVSTWRNSESLFEQALSVNPASWLANAKLGYSDFQRGRWSDAARHYRAALAISPRDAEACNNLGAALIETGDTTDGLTEIRSAADIEPQNAGWRFSLGTEEMKAGQFADAIVQLREAVALDAGFPNAMANLMLTYDKQGADQVTAGQLDAAIATWREALAVDPDDANAHYNIGVCLLKERKKSDAAAEFQAALRIQPDNANAKAALAEAQ